MIQFQTKTCMLGHVHHQSDLYYHDCQNTIMANGHHHHDHHRSPLWPIANWPSLNNVTLTIMIVLITLVILIIMIVIGMPFVFTGRTCARPVGPDSWLNRG